MEGQIEKARKPGRPPKVGGDTRGAILDAALELFAERGFFGTSMRDIARKVGIRESGIYNHFASKEALLDALLECSGAEAEAQLPGELAPGETLEDVLVGFVTRVLELFATARQRRIYRVMMADGMRLHDEGRVDFHERIGAHRRQFAEFFERLKAHGQIRGEVNAAQAELALMSPIMAYRNFVALAPGEAPDARTFARRHVDLLLHGLAIAPGRQENGAST